MDEGAIMRNQIWRDGELIDVIEIDDIETDEQNLESQIVISNSAIDDLITKLEDPAINSIAEIKTALTSFFVEVKGS